MFADGAEVGPDVEERVGTILGSPAAADLLVEFDHPDVAFGLVVLERDPEVGREPQDVVAVGGEPGEWGSGWAQGGAAGFAGPWWWRVERRSFRGQSVVASAEPESLRLDSDDDPVSFAVWTATWGSASSSASWTGQC